MAADEIVNESMDVDQVPSTSNEKITKTGKNSTLPWYVTSRNNKNIIIYKKLIVK